MSSKRAADARTKVKAMDQVETGIGGNDRRGFLKAVLMMGMAGAAGVTTWWVTREDERAVVSVVGSPAQVTPQVRIVEPPASPPTVEQSRGGIEAKALSDPGADLQGELDLALERVDSLTSELAAFKTRTADLEAQLASTEGRVGVLGGLLALYTQLDELELDEVVEGGLDELGFWIDQALSHVPVLRRGLATADRLLGQLEMSLPSIEDGIGWLQGVVNRLADALQVMEDSLEETVEPLEPLAAKLADFVAKILGWLPFGVGKRVQRGLDGILGVLTHVPELVRSTDSLVLAPLGDWFSRDGEQPAIQNALIDPVKTDALGPAGRLATDVEVVDKQLTEKLADPVRVQLSARKPVREEIGRYREQYGL
jgi:hypothetical protein